MNETVESALKGLIDRYGVAILDESGRLKGFLQDECPSAKREISVLMMALEEQVPQDLMRVHSGEPLHSLAPRLASRLSDQKALAPDASAWAVHAWAHGLGMESIAAVPAHADNFGEASALAVVDAPAVQALPEAGAALAVGPKDVEGGLLPSNRKFVAIAAIVLAAIAAWFMLGPKSFEITRVETADALVGDGKSHPVFVDFKPGKVPVKSIQVGYVRGDIAPAAAAPFNAPVSEESSGKGRVQAGAITYRSAKPASATFQYVLVAADGTRSAPFEKTFEIGVAPVQPPAITTIDVPSPIVVGKDFTVTIGFEAGTGDVVQVRRKVVETSVKWATDEMSANVKPASGGKSVPYTFAAPKVPFKSTVEFVLVDANGSLSEPKRVSFEVLPALPIAVNRPATSCRYCGTVVAVRAYEQPRQATGLGAIIGGIAGGVVGHQVGSGRGRDVATAAGAVGGAVVGHNVEKNARGNTVYEVTVRYDSGKSQTVRDGGQGWRKGDRVRVVDGRLAREQ